MAAVALGLEVSEVWGIVRGERLGQGLTKDHRAQSVSRREAIAAPMNGDLSLRSRNGLVRIVMVLAMG